MVYGVGGVCVCVCVLLLMVDDVVPTRKYYGDVCEKMSGCTRRWGPMKEKKG